MPSGAPFGRWPSPLAADEVAAGRMSLSELQSDGAALYWLESRPLESGRTVCVRYRDGRCRDHSPEGVSIRSRVHEYGGGALCVVPRHRDGAFAYVDQADQRIWFCDGEGTAPRPLTSTPVDASWRHGGLSSSPDGSYVLAVREIHRTTREPSTPERRVVAISVNAAEPTESVVLDGHGFYGTARLDDGTARIVATTWDHPDMPWDASKIVVSRVIGAPDALTADGAPWAIATAPDRAESVGQPFWLRDGNLVFVSDHGGWWQPYVHSGHDDGRAPRALITQPAEFHGPDWNLGQRTMAELPDGTLVARMTQDGRDALVIIDPDIATNSTAPASQTTSSPAVLEQPCVAISNVVAHGDQVAYIGATPDKPTAVYLLTPNRDGRTRAQPALTEVTTAVTTLAPADIAHGEALHLTGRSGRPIHANFYRPTLRGMDTPADAKPPLIVFCHSGPTTAAQLGFDPALHFFITRGFAVVAPNYAGSTGYGRAYREALNGQWGIADAQDCLDTALALAGTHVDPTKMAIRGTSAGGFTALNALAAGEGFAACASWYGVTDLMTLTATTHDFEAHYNDRLVGPLPEAADLYTERSPLAHASDMDGAVLLLQGSDDPVVPVAQAHQLHDALVSAGRICELHIFDGEGHGFRRAETLKAAYELELAFYRTHLKL
jgi:dienelactone hydrolase